MSSSFVDHRTRSGRAEKVLAGMTEVKVERHYATGDRS